MVIEQTVEIPPSHRLTIDVPKEVPAGRAILTFTPQKSEGGYSAESGEPANAAARAAIPEASRGNTEDPAFRNAIRSLQDGGTCRSGKAVTDSEYWHTAPLSELDAEIERRLGRPVADEEELKLFRGILRAQGAWKNNPWKNCIEDIRAMREEWDHRDPWNSDPAQRHRD